MIDIIRIVKASSGSWHLSFRGKSYPINKKDEGIIKILNPSDDQLCIITDLSTTGALLYFLKDDSGFHVYTYPDNTLRVTTTSSFLPGLEDNTKYYLIPKV